MNQVADTKIKCSFHPNESIEYICVAKNCFYQRGPSSPLYTQQDSIECGSRLCCIKCMENHHQHLCGQNCFLLIKENSFEMPVDFDPISQKVLDMASNNRVLVEQIDTLFDEIKKQFIKKIDSEKKNIIKQITLLNTDIFELHHRITKKWNFSKIYSTWIDEMKGKTLQDPQLFSKELEEKILKCNNLTETISKEFKDSSTTFQVFTNLEKQLRGIKENIECIFEKFDLQRNNELSRNQEFSFISSLKTIDVSSNEEGYQIIRNHQQCYFDCYSSENLNADRTYQVLFSFNRVPSHSVTVGLVNSDGINNSRLEKKISQSMVYSYHKHMGEVVKGLPLYSTMKANEVYKLVVNVRKNILYIADEQESNITTLDNQYEILKGRHKEKLQEQNNKDVRASYQSEDKDEIKWRIFFSMFEPVMNIKIIKTIIY